jgi:glutaredoxin
MIELFVLETCPYCKKVMDYMDLHDIQYKKIDIMNKFSEEALIKIGGKRQVPFMIDKNRNVQMYESDDIIEYLKTLK